MSLFVADSSFRIFMFYSDFFGLFGFSSKMFVRPLEMITLLLRLFKEYHKISEHTIKYHKIGQSFREDV